MQIRRATRDDLPAILAISNWAAQHTPANFAIEPETPETWQSSWEATEAMYPWLVAAAGPEVIGFAKASPHRARCAYLHSAEVTVYVHRDHHRKGVGRALYAALMPVLQGQGYFTVTAGITLPNPASVRLHESFGFRQVGVFERIGYKFGRFHDVSYWQAFLQPANQEPKAIKPVECAYHDSDTITS